MILYTLNHSFSTAIHSRRVAHRALQEVCKWLRDGGALWFGNDVQRTAGGGAQGVGCVGQCRPVSHRHRLRRERHLGNGDEDEDDYEDVDVEEEEPLQEPEIGEHAAAEQTWATKQEVLCCIQVSYVPKSVDDKKSLMPSQKFF